MLRGPLLNAFVTDLALVFADLVAQGRDSWEKSGACAVCFALQLWASELVPKASS